MRRLIQLFFTLAILVGTQTTWAQTSTPTFTATDPDSQTWNNGTYSVVLVSSSGQAVPQGQAIRVDTGATVTVSVSSQTLNGSGAGSITLVNNSNINPAGTQWRFNVCSNTLPQFCGTSTLAISSSSSISTQISASLPAPRIGGGIGAQGYADVEASATPNNSYYNVTTPSCRLYTSSWGACGGGGGGPPTGTAGGSLAGTYPNPTFAAGTVAPAQQQFSVTKYAAVCDGSTNDATAIQAAITAAAAVGGNVVIPSGTCNFATTLTRPRNVMIVGQGRNSSYLNYTGSTRAFVLGDTGSNNPPAWKGGFQHVSLEGPSGTGSTVGVYMGADPAGTISPTGNLDDDEEWLDFAVQKFGLGVQVANNAYLLTAIDFLDANNNQLWKDISTNTNSGERMSFVSSIFGQSQSASVPAIELDNNLGDYYFTNSSIDYNNTSQPDIACLAGNMHVTLTNVHMEKAHGERIHINNTVCNGEVHIFGGEMTTTGTGTTDNDMIGLTGSFTSQNVVSVIGTAVNSNETLTQFIDANNPSRQITVDSLGWENFGNLGACVNTEGNPIGIVIRNTQGCSSLDGPGGSIFYLSSYLANPNVPTQIRWDCTWSISSSPSTITCPTGTFTSNMTGWVAWATQLNPGGNAEVANNFACGGAGTNPSLTYVSSTTATLNTACSVASGSSTNGGSAFVFGPDETTGVDNWILAVANSCGTGILPSGTVLTKHGGGGWNMTAAQNTNCGNATGVHTGGAIINGQGITRSTIGIEPAFDFTTCTGGPTSNTCFGSAKTNASGILVGGYSFSNFSMSGFGSTLDASTQTNWVEMLYGNYANNFAITKLGGTGVSHTVGIKLNGAFGQFWNLISDWAGAIPCWVTNGSPYAPNVMGGSSECVGGSGAAVSGIGSSYGVFISSGGWLVSHGSTFAGGDTNNIASDVAISGGTYESYGDSACCTNTGTVMAIISFDANGGTAIIDGFWGTITNMGNGSHFLSTASSGSPYISIRNTNVVIGGGTGQQCYDILSATAVFVDGGANNCSGSSSASTFSNTSGNTGLGLINPIGMILLSKQKLASTATNFTFSSIPQYYTNLHIVCAFQEGGGGSNLSMQLNADTAAHYGYSYIYNNSGAPNSSTAQTGQTSSLVGIGTSGATIIEIPNYSGTTLTSTYFTGVSSGPGSNENGSTGGVWAGNAVTSVKIFDSGGASFSIGSTCNLYALP